MKVCTLDPSGRICLGCLRTADEIAGWASVQRCPARAGDRSACRSGIGSSRAIEATLEPTAAAPRCGIAFGCGANGPEGALLVHALSARDARGRRHLPLPRLPRGGRQLRKTMGHRLTRIYTKTGDDGTTGLGDGSRVSKDDLRDRGDGRGGRAQLRHRPRPRGRSPARGAPVPRARAARSLRGGGGALAFRGRCASRRSTSARLERELDGFNADLPPLKEFILPGGTPAAADAHLARAVCRRVERTLVALGKHEQTGDDSRPLREPALGPALRPDARPQPRGRPRRRVLAAGEGRFLSACRAQSVERSRLITNPLRASRIRTRRARRSRSPRRGFASHEVELRLHQR